MIDIFLHPLHFLHSVAAVAFTFGLVIFLHEFGHFIMCIKLGVRVERFAFGFGPELIGVTHNGTRLSINAFPLGGFVKPAGDNLEDCTGEPNEYFSKSWKARLVIVAAGPFMNYVLAFTLFFLFAFFQGLPIPSKAPVIGELEEGYPAEQTGIKLGDKIVRVGDTDIADWEQLADTVHHNAEKPMDITVDRDNQTLHIQVTPKLDPASGQGLLGILPKIEYHRVGIFGAAREGAEQCWFWTAYTVKTLVEKIQKHERPDVAGPVGIVQMVSKAAHSGMEELLYLVALISVAVGFFNLLPVPLLDGGWGALYIWEGIRHKKLTAKMMATANSIGLVFLLSLLIFATYNDFLRIREQRMSKTHRPAAEGKASPSPN